jgi:hypothetical protein
VDDLVPLLQADEAQVVRDYQTAVWNGIDETVRLVTDCYNQIKTEMKSTEKREFAVHFVKKVEPKDYQPFLFTLWDSKDLKKALVDKLLISCSSQNRVDNNRWMMNGATLNVEEIQE